MRHVAGVCQMVHGDAVRQALALADGQHAVLKAPDHLNRQGQRGDISKRQGLLPVTVKDLFHDLLQRFDSTRP